MRHKTTILSLFALLCTLATFASAPKHITVRGSVVCEGKGVAGVAVTDGAMVALTDKKGNYTIETSSVQKFIYYSLPSGYESPTVNGIPRFYAEIESSKSDQKINFTLTKALAPQDKHAFVVWADPQVLDPGEVELLKEVVADLKRTIAKLGNQPLHAISCGDNVFDRMELFEPYTQVVATAGIPFYQVAGNHDLDYNKRSDEYSARSYSNHFGPAWYSFNKGNIHYVVLKDVFYYGYSYRYMGYIDEKQLSWLEQDLSHVKPGSTVVVSLHIPTIYGDSDKPSSYGSEISNSLMNREALYKILKPFQVHIMAGHSHTQWNTIVSENIMEHTHAAASAAWWQGEIGLDGTPKGYTVYQANGNDLTWSFKGVNLPDDEQFKIYPAGADTTQPQYFIANVYNYDPQWRVEWYEDGVKTGTMEQYWGEDPLAKELYQPGKNKKHSWLSVGETHHLFRAKAVNPNAKIKVVVTDRFGKTYQKEL